MPFKDIKFRREYKKVWMREQRRKGRFRYYKKGEKHIKYVKGITETKEELLKRYFG